MRQPKLRILTVVFLIGLVSYLGFLCYNAYWQPVVLVVPNDFRGVVRVQYQPRGFDWLLGYKKRIIVHNREPIVLRSRLPYEQYCGTVGMYADGREIENGDSERPAADEKVRLYLVGFVEHREAWFVEAWFVVGTEDDFRAAAKEKWRIKKAISSGVDSSET